MLLAVSVQTLLAMWYFKENLNAVELQGLHGTKCFLKTDLASEDGSTRGYVRYQILAFPN